MLRAWRGFLFDLLLTAAAAGLAFHPVYDFARERLQALYWAVSLSHVVLSLLMVAWTMIGYTRGADLILNRQGPLHERAYVWSMVLTLGCGFILPFVGPLALPGITTHLGLAMAVVFAPLAGFLGTAGLVLGLLPNGAELKRGNPFNSRVGTLMLGSVLAAYLVLLETLLFLLAESNHQIAGLVSFLGLFLSYLPLRLFVFYNVTRSESRIEVVSAAASFVFICVQVVAQRPH